MPSARLLELYGRGLGVLDEARVEFGPGFNVLTGETGAGKTLLLGALQLCLGEDAAMRAAVRENLAVVALVADSGGEQVAFGRELGASGRLRATLNAAPSSVEALRERGRALISVHGQHDSLRLTGRGEIRALLDASAGIDATRLEDVRAQLRAATRELGELGGSEVDRAREVDFINFQLDELERINVLSPDELGECLDELERLSQLRDGQAALARLVEGLDDGPQSPLGQLARAVADIPAGAAYDPARASLGDALAAARQSLSDLAALADPESVDLGRLEWLEARIATLSELARKYGSLERALSESASLAQRREQLASGEQRRQLLLASVENLGAERARLSGELLEARREAATRLERRVAAQLPRVALSEASLRFVVEGEDGSQVDLLLRGGPGQREGSLSEVASGGELSRVLLALALETVGDDTVAVFDEIDAGLGGQVAQQIGECLAELGRRQQVLVVTHLASVAARAAHHFVVRKSLVDGAMRTQVREVRAQERVREIARMLAGDAGGEESYALAQRLLDTHS